MSIISSEADSIYESSAWPDHPDVLRQLYDSDDLREAYERGASRQPTEEEIGAGAKACYETLWKEWYGSAWPWSEADIIEREIFPVIVKATLKAMQGKATEC